MELYLHSFFMDTIKCHMTFKNNVLREWQNAVFYLYYKTKKLQIWNFIRQVIISKVCKF